MESKHSINLPSHVKSRYELNLRTFEPMKVLESGETTLDSLVEEFQQLGGRIEPGIVFEITQISEGCADIGWKEFFELSLPQDGKIYPVCEAGENRSQILALVLNRKFAGQFQVEKPHGAKGSVDPFILPAMTADELQDSESVDWEKEMAYQFSPKIDDPLYQKEFKTTRVTRVGEEEILKKHGNKIQERNPAALREARQYMDKNYFKKIIENRGHVIAFNKGFHIMLMRLVEVAKREKPTFKKPLNGVVLHPIKSDDPVVMKIHMSFYMALSDLIKVTSKEENLIEEDNQAEQSDEPMQQPSNCVPVLTMGSCFLAGGAVGYLGGMKYAASVAAIGASASIFVAFCTAAGAGLLLLIAYLINRMRTPRPGLFSSRLSDSETDQPQVSDSPRSSI